MAKFMNKIKGKGWRPDVPSFKDYPFAFAKAQLIAQGFGEITESAAPASVKRPSISEDRRAAGQNIPVRDQGNLGSCVGFSSTYGVGFLRRTDRDALSTIYSPLQMYYDARIRDGMQWKDVDAGAYIRDAMDALRETGVAPDGRWPYKVSKFATTPTKSVYKAAASWKLGAHYRCDTLDDILTAIAHGFAVVGGIACFSSMFSSQVDRTGVIPMPTRDDDNLGGHALYFDMYDESAGQIRFENSWGEGWGDHGYGYLPLAYAEDRNLSDDWWAMTAESPATTPWKD